MTIRTRGSVTLITAGLLLSACSTVQTPIKQDPWEGFNRTVFTVNDKADQYAFRPVAKAYNWSVPQPVRTALSNAFSNVDDVSVAANKFLQGNFKEGVETVMRVAINSVFGLGGLMDIATPGGLPKMHADFGLTLGTYGIPAGPYMVLPFFGPSTVRDTVGMVGDGFMDPLSYVRPDWAAYTLFGVKAIGVRAALLNATDLLSDAALDKYSFVRNAYLQRRQYMLGKNQGDSLPNYGDDSEDDSAAASVGIHPTGNASVGGARAAGNAAAAGAAPAKP